MYRDLKLTIIICKISTVPKQIIDRRYQIHMIKQDVIFGVETKS